MAGAGWMSRMAASMGRIVVGTRPAVQSGMITRPLQQVPRPRRLWQTISALQWRIQQERLLLAHPGMELAAARELARTQRRLEGLRNQLR
jgi:hypothetical protein